MNCEGFSRTGDAISGLQAKQHLDAASSTGRAIWQEYYSLKWQRYYYYNDAQGETRWAMPLPVGTRPEGGGGGGG